MENQKGMPPAVGGDVATIFVAIELSTKSWLVALQTSLQARPSRHKLSALDVGSLVALIERVRSGLVARGAREVRVVSIYEAGRDGFWLDRLLEARGVGSHVVDPGSILVRRRARRAKTDRLDAEGLLRLLIQREAGNLQLGRMCVVPSVAEEDARRPTRERARLVGERTAHSHRIKGLLALHGIAGYRPLRSDRRVRLAQLRCADGSALPPGLEAEIERELERLELVEAQIAKVEAARAARLKVADDRDASTIRRLARLRSIAIQSASLLTCEVFYRSFPNRRAVTSFVGIAPTPHKSGNVDHEQGIAKAGNKRARAALVELAWLWLRHQPDSELSLWFKARQMGCRTGAQKRKLVVALAGRLLVQLWRYVTEDRVPPGAMLKA